MQKIFTCSIIFIFIFCIPRFSYAELLYAIAFRTSSYEKLLAYDYETNEVIREFSLMSIGAATSAAMDDSSGLLYTWSEGDTIYRINPVTGHFTRIGNGGHFDAYNIRALAIHPQTFELYAITYPGKLYKVDKSNGELDFIGSSAAISFAHGLAFSPDGTLYCSDTEGVGYSKLYTINPDSADATFVTNINRNHVLSLDFNKYGELFAVNRDLFFGKVNIENGNWTDMWNFASIGEIQGIAFEPIPEPTTLSLLVLGSLILVSHRRRKSYNFPQERIYFPDTTRLWKYTNKDTTCDTTLDRWVNTDMIL